MHIAKNVVEPKKEKKKYRTFKEYVAEWKLLKEKAKNEKNEKQLYDITTLTA